MKWRGWKIMMEKGKKMKGDRRVNEVKT